MRGENTILEYLKRVQAIAKTGLSYAKDRYDLERYEELSENTNDLLAEYSRADLDEIRFNFESLEAYPTPKVDVRGVVLRENEILLIQEKSDGKWALPGGWADIGFTPAENVIKEMWEESGLEVRVDRLLAVWDKRKHDHPDDIHYVYKLNFLCTITGGELLAGHETLAVNFFDIDSLPELSLMRNTAAQIKELHRLAHSSEVSFD